MSGEKNRVWGVAETNLNLTWSQGADRWNQPDQNGATTWRQQQQQHSVAILAQVRGHSWPGLSERLPCHLLWVWIEVTRAALHVRPVASCFRGAACPYKLRGRRWLVHEERTQGMEKDVSSPEALAALIHGLSSLQEQVATCSRRSTSGSESWSRFLLPLCRSAGTTSWYTFSA